MTITIRDIISNPHLKTSIIAGSGGLDREITWAHVCELQDPTQWLSGGELILTTGLAIPRFAQEQEKYLQRLIGVGVCGIAIAENMYAPELTNHLLSEADRKSFPVLLTSYEVPWLAITRTVAEANTHIEHARVLQTLRIYEIARKIINISSLERIIDILNEVIDCSLYVVDPVNKRTLFNDIALPIDVKEILELIRPMDDPASPAVQRTVRKGITVLHISIPASRPAILVAITHSDVTPNNLVLRHVATILGLFIEKDTVIHERKRRLGAELFAGLIDDRISGDAAIPLLAEHEILEKPCCIVACSGETQPIGNEWLHLHLYNRNIPHLLIRRENNILAYLPSNTEAISSLIDELPPNVRFGISNIFENPSKTSEGLRQALWALKAAENNDKNIVYYNEELPVSPFLPRSREEANDLIKQVIGELLAYDKKNNSQLVMTLSIYLNENRSWKETSKQLHIHKQTLVYRISKIEQLTGRRLNVTKSVSELWLALQTAIMLGIIPDFSEKN